MIRIAHVITGLNTGGAETMLYKLLSRTDRGRFQPAVWCLTDEGPIAEKIRGLDIPVSSLEMTRSVPEFGSVVRLSQALRSFHPDLVQTWLYHADVIGGIAARMAGVRRVVWNIRNSAFDPARAKRSTIQVARLAARLSSIVPDRILCCSEIAKAEHIRLGYNARKFAILPNGFDIAALKPDSEARKSVRQELCLLENAVLIGHVARFDPQKDHETLFRAIADVRKSHPDLTLVCCGDGVTIENPKIAEMVAATGIGASVRLLGRRADIPRLNAAFDLGVSSSRYGEGFPNVIGEAMACGVPCVVTESGDGPMVVGDTGRVVPAGDSQAFAHAVSNLLSLPPLERQALGQAARQRIIEHFELGHVASRYADFYDSLVTSKPKGRR